MAYAYDDQNIFAKILRGEIPNSTVAESEHTLAFLDISPQAPVHILVIPKGQYVTADHFAAEASPEEITDFWKTFAQIVSDQGVGDGGNGYRMISNSGSDGVQDVPHFHLHILAGRRLGPMLQRV
ncbi:MAG: HIT domain-containing protein [Boseongicola sp.]|nr:HIT domain-containing protein [Boseongicola sp.]MDD9979527.1 HIT domain-containing protein [Boseongicola sp.]